MTTMTTNAVENTCEVKKLSQMITNHASYLKQWAISKGYSFDGEISNPENLQLALQKSSKRTIKRINAMLRQKPSIRSANIFLHFISKRTGTSLAKINLSERESEIISARKAWKTQQKIANQMLEEYKSLKGDFYKKDRIA